MIYSAGNKEVQVRNTETGHIVGYAYFIDTEKRIIKTFARHPTENRCLVDENGLVRNSETYPAGKYVVESVIDGMPVES